MIDLERVTPAKAAEWLQTNKQNRKLRKQTVMQYTADMLSGSWTRCVTPISFYDDGELADGQHRLQAVVESKTTQAFYVIRGLNRRDGLNIDTGLARSVTDAARIVGKSDLSYEMVAVARGIEFGRQVSIRSLSNAEKLAILDRHRAAVDFACKNGPKGRIIRNAITLSAIARAWSAGADPEDLARFARVLQDGMPTGTHEHAAVALRNYLLSSGAVLASSAMWSDTFKRAQHCIKAFCQGRPLTVLKPVNEECYPLVGGRGAELAHIRSI